MRFIAYFRVSTTRQGQSGLGLEAQRDQVLRHVQQCGGQLVSEHVEIESGTRNARPILQQALAECRRTKAILLIAKLDRLARNVSFISNILDSNVSFVACDNPHADRTFLQLLAVFAEHEARMISERTKAALAAAKSRGVILGSFSRTLADRHIADATSFALEMAAPIVAARQAGAITLAEIADWLNHAGYRTREAGQWMPMTVARVVKRLTASGVVSQTREAA